MSGGFKIVIIENFYFYYFLQIPLSLKTLPKNVI